MGYGTHQQMNLVQLLKQPAFSFFSFMDLIQKLTAKQFALGGQ